MRVVKDGEDSKVVRRTYGVPKTVYFGLL